MFSFHFHTKNQGHNQNRVSINKVGSADRLMRAKSYSYSLTLWEQGN